jgi:GDPmannose 4,6-dehydratase
LKVDPRYFRPAEVETLLGNASRAKAELGWIPEIALDDMIAEMVAADLHRARRHALLHKNGFSMAVSPEG